MTTQTAEKTQLLGKDIQLVNPLPQATLDKVIEALQAFHSTMGSSKWNKVANILKFIAGGYCGKVYDLGEYILKINKRDSVEDNELRDGQIMHALQGLPCIPKIYLYAQDNSFMVVQKIKGQTVAESQWKTEFMPEGWNYEEQKARLDETKKQMDELGWVMADCHSENCMVDDEGNFWLIDLGLFHKTHEDGWGRNYSTAVHTLEKMNGLITTHKEAQEWIEKAKNKATQKDGFRMSVVEFAEVVNGPKVRDQAYYAGSFGSFFDSTF